MLHRTRHFAEPTRRGWRASTVAVVLPVVSHSIELLVHCSRGIDPRGLAGGGDLRPNRTCAS